MTSGQGRCTQVLRSRGMQMDLWAEGGKEINLEEEDSECRSGIGPWPLAKMQGRVHIAII